MRPNAYLHSLLSLLLLAGCAERLEMPSVIDGGTDSPGRTIEDGTPIDVPFSVSYSPLTKSSLTIGEDTVSDVNIVAFKNGVRTTFVYTTPDSDITLQLLKGESYNIYAVANVGAISIPSSESDFLDYSYSIDSIDDLNGGFPMWWKLEGFTAGVLTSPVDIELERLVAKVRLSLMAPDMEGFEVTSVRLCQAASTIRPFAAGGSRALSGETLDGDYASAADLTTINNGGSICFYTFENCQGTLLEGNTDPWNKVPDNMGGKDDVCTYIEITCEHDGSFLLDGTVTYRMYLGADNSSNFDILRNKNYNLTLTATYAGMSQADISWKVDVDCEVSNAGDAGIQVGAHAEDDLYIGEVIVMGFSTSQAFDDYNGGEPFDCELVLVKNGVESDAAWFEEINDGGYNKSYDCVMHCVDVVSGAELYLKKDNHLICKLPLGSGEKISIQKPFLQIFEPQATAYINGPDAKPFEIHLIDSNNERLTELTDSYDFDLNVFEDLWTITPEFAKTLHINDEPTLGNRLADCISISESTGEGDFNYDVNVINSGIYGDVCYNLSKYWDSLDQYQIHFGNSKCIGASKYLTYDVIRPRIALGFDSDFEDYSSAGETYAYVRNPSKIALKLSMYQLSYDGNRSFKALPFSYTERVYSTTTTMTAQLRSSYSYQDYLLISNTSNERALWGYCTENLYYPSSVVSFVDTDNYINVKKYTDPNGDDIVYISPGLLKGNWDYVTTELGSVYTSLSTEDVIGIDVRTVNDATLYYSRGNSSGSTGYDSGIASFNYYEDNDILYEGSSTLRTFFTGLKPKNLYSMTHNPLSFSFSSGSAGFGVNIVNSSDETFTIETTMTVSGNCTWQSYSTQSSHTDKHSLTKVYSKNSVKSGNIVLIPTSYIDSAISELNQNYWHNCSSNAVAAQGNRYSKFTIPNTIAYEVKITVNNLIVLQTSFSNNNYSPTCTIYTRTADGHYADNGSVNPDGTDRDIKNIKYSPSFSGASTQSGTSLTTTSKVNDEHIAHLYLFNPGSEF